MTADSVSPDDYQPVIGLEIHVQLKTQSKLFSSAANQYGCRANSQVSVIDLGMPGVLPVVNRAVIICAVRLGLAINARIHRSSVFARKHYFYPDLPKGYQISQLEDPIIADGQIELEDADGNSRVIDVVRAHLEEDAGKLVHSNSQQSGVDFNRSGVPLLEVVTAPQLRSPSEAANLMRKLHALVRYLDICTGNLEEGAFRCDANVSLRPTSAAPLGTRTELKNINSFRFVEKAIEFEIDRQRACLSSGEPIVQETRLYDADRHCTVPMRSKEDAQDYRYFPDPDLLPIRISEAWIEDIRASMPDLPAARARVWQEQYQVKADDARLLSADRSSADYFDATITASPERASETAAWIVHEVLPRLSDQQTMIDCPVSPQLMVELITRLTSQALTVPMARQLLDLLWQGEQDIDRLVEQHQLRPVSDEDDLTTMLNELFDRHPEQWLQLKAGKKKIRGFFVGQVMKKTSGRADPRAVDRLIDRQLSLAND